MEISFISYLCILGFQDFLLSSRLPPATRWRLKSAEWHGGGSGADRAGSCAALCLRLSEAREIAAHFEQPIIARHHCATEVAGGSVQAM